MSPLVKHSLTSAVTVAIFGSLSALEGIGGKIATGQIPWISGSIFASVFWGLFLCIVIFAPVATTTAFFVEHKLNIKWYFEPILLFAGLAFYTLPFSLLVFGASLHLSLIFIVSFYLPSLTYFYLVRALNFRDYL